MSNAVCLQRGSDECYALFMTCLCCHKSWGWADYTAKLQFCPHCGVAFARIATPTEASAKHRERRLEAEWRSFQAAKQREIRYSLQRRAEYDKEWTDETDWHYIVTTSARQAIGDWKHRLKAGSWFGEDVRMIARINGRERVVLGPIHLNER